MLLYISHNFFHYEAGNLCRLFFPYDDLKTTLDAAETINSEDIVSAVIDGDNFNVSIRKDGRTASKKIIESNHKDDEYNITATMFLCLSEFCGYVPKWGLLTGIHPVKLYTQYLQRLGGAGADEVFAKRFYVSSEKLSLCRRIAAIQQPSIEALEENDFSLYISIPFCPTRCAYCSFVSQSVEKQKKLIEPYVVKLLQEIAYTASITKKTGLRLVAVYMGGGTPTTLNSDQLRRVIETVKTEFDMSACREFTVEAGRPDTIDEDKLKTLLSLGISRISINPQSLDDNVLMNIGRRHTAQETIDAYELARHVGISEINMDLIAGLQGDTIDTFSATLEKVLELSPANVTVHSLALKRSAEIFHREDTQDFHKNKGAAEEMIDYSIRRLTEEGYEPYYLYRQSRMAGNLENTGWAKKGTACAYNIYTMDETHTVVACGAGGVSKIKDPYSDRLERIFNFKYSYEYLERFDQILVRKEGVNTLYEQFRKRLH